MHFFHVHCSTKSQENLKGPKFSILKFLVRKKMCMFYSSSWIIFLNLRVTDQCQDRPPRYNIRVIFPKMLYFFYNFIAIASLRTLCYCLLKLKAIIKSPHGKKVYLGRSKYKARRRI